MAKKQRNRKPQGTLQPDTYAIIRDLARRNRDKIETVLDDIILTGLKIKRLLPETFRQQTPTR